MHTLTLKSKATDLAMYWATIATDILFSGKGQAVVGISRTTLENTLYNAMLQKLIDFDTCELTELEFQECMNQSKITEHVREIRVLQVAY